ncbi:MAG: hypothetical protein LBG15_15785 [Dysgonamonadaceae bacterium]|jgi:hypothetical protein|nr:hypothetical protein [Dysgonamonadaceae bacterium]
MKKKETRILKWLLILVSIFISFYLIYPYFISIEQANRYNIKKFDKNRTFFQNVINWCIDSNKNIDFVQQEKIIKFEELPITIQKQLLSKGISHFQAIIIKEQNRDINVIANFYTERFWFNRVLNHVVIKYDSYYKGNICNENSNNLRAYMSSICLGKGWFFEIDTDWL